MNTATTNVHPTIAAALEPFAPKPCGHVYTRETGGVLKCIDCGACMSLPEHTIQERDQATQRGHA